MRERRIDQAAFGAVYGTITVIALLMSMHTPVENAWRTALILFGSVLVVAVAKSYAELCERMLQSARPAQWDDVRAVWSHSQTTLLAANGPALAFVLAGMGLYSGDAAYLIAQGLALSLLVYFGARIGWRAQRSVQGAVIGAVVTGGLGTLISLLKFAAH